MTVETEVAALTTAVNSLTSTVNVSKATLDAAAAEAVDAYDSFDDRYLGVKNSAPANDNDGGALLTGALYFNSTSNTMFVFTGSAWAAVANNNIINPNVALTQDLATNGNDVKFGDNDKATFGAGDDLQIYHDGSHSQIKDAGTGNLYIKATSGVLIQDNDTGTNRITTSATGPVYVYHAGDQKLATTSTGIDVTGTATMDGLTVDGNIQFTDSGSSNRNVLYLDDSDNVVLATGTTAGARGIDLYTNNSKSLSVAEGGDISFYEDTGTTPKLFWDASAESLGIGTSSPDTVLHLAKSSAATLRLESTATALATGGVLGAIEFESNDTGSQSGVNAKINSVFTNTVGATSLQFFTSDSFAVVDSTPKMVINNVGNVGIGTSSPNLNGFGTGTNGLEIADATLAGIRLNGNAADSMYFISGADKHWVYGRGAVPMTFSTNGEEAMQIDSSGNLLLNRSATFTTAKMEIQSDAGDASTLALNSIDTDGSMLEFYNAGTTVGSIGVKDGYLTAGNADAGLLFLGSGVKRIQPWSVSSNSGADNQIDLGYSTERFKDLYLSGGVYLGGTGAANKLDDYEEGTWTPTLGGGATATNMSGKYTKVGNLVTAYLIFENSTISGTPDYIVSGLPFTSVERTPLSVTYYRTFNTACESLGGFLTGNGNTMQFVGMVQGGNWVTAPLTAGSTRYLFATAVYQAA